MYPLQIAVAIVLVGVCVCLPPFEIRSASSQRSEGAVDWIKHLQREKVCNRIEASERLVCPSSSLYSPECVSWGQLCDGAKDCPRGEDEASYMCIFLKQKERLQRESFSSSS